MRERIRFEATEELRSDLVARCEEEEIEKDRLHQGRNFNVQLTDEDAGEETADDNAEREAAELHAANQESNCNRQEDRELRVLAQGGNEIIHESPQVGKNDAWTEWRVKRARAAQHRKLPVQSCECLIKRDFDA